MESFQPHLYINPADVACSTSQRICRALFGGSGDMVHAVGRAMAFLSVVGYMLALTVYYFDIWLDIENWRVSSEICEFPRP